MISFEWEARKADSNIRKHGVSFEEAQSVFYDENAIQFFDDSESTTDEDRFLMLGLSYRLRILLVCHCVKQGEVIRIISARKATKSEANYYNK